MNTMTTTEFVIAAIPFVLALLMMMLALYTWGYSQGSKAIALPYHEVINSPLPEVFYGAEESPITGPIQISVLEPTTGPIDIILPNLILVDPLAITQEEVDELQEARVKIARLEEELHEQALAAQKKEKLRARYFRLLKNERTLLKEALIGKPVHLSPYWKKYLNSTIDRFDINYPIISDWQPTIKLPMMPQTRLYAITG